jgi:hypothetical protein
MRSPGNSSSVELTSSKIDLVEGQLNALQLSRQSISEDVSDHEMGKGDAVQAGRERIVTRADFARNLLQDVAKAGIDGFCVCPMDAP